MSALKLRVSLLAPHLVEQRARILTEIGRGRGDSEHAQNKRLGIKESSLVSGRSRKKQKGLGKFSSANILHSLLILCNSKTCATPRLLSLFHKLRVPLAGSCNTPVIPVKPRQA